MCATTAHTAERLEATKRAKMNLERMKRRRSGNDGIREENSPTPTTCGLGLVSPLSATMSRTRSHQCSLKNRSRRVFNCTTQGPAVGNQTSYRPIDSNWCEVTTKGDGNCFYRAVLKAVGLHEEEFSKVRLTMASYMESNCELFKDKLLSGEDMKQHIDNVRNCDGQQSSWATEIEIEALSRMLKCSVYVLVKEGRDHTWACYSEGDMSGREEYLALVHRDGNHFNVAIPANGYCYCQVKPPGHPS